MDSNRHQPVAVTKLENDGELIISTAGLTVNANHRTHHSGNICNFIEIEIILGQGRMEEICKI